MIFVLRKFFFLCYNKFILRKLLFKILVMLLLFKLLMGVILESYKRSAKKKLHSYNVVTEVVELFQVAFSPQSIHLAARRRVGWRFTRAGQQTTLPSLSAKNDIDPSLCQEV